MVSPTTATVAPSYNKDGWKTGEVAEFEYHCLEKPESADAPVWYRSHQQVKVLGEGESEGHCGTLAERGVEGTPLTYKVKFADGLEWTVFEDELMTSREGFFRPDPPPER